MLPDEGTAMNRPARNRMAVLLAAILIPIGLQAQVGIQQADRAAALGQRHGEVERQVTLAHTSLGWPRLKKRKRYCTGLHFISECYLRVNLFIP